MNQTEKYVIFLTQVGYKISNLFGKILFTDKAPFGTLADAKKFCEDNGYAYEVA